MGVHTAMTMARAGNVLISNPFATQIDTMSQEESSYWGGGTGAVPYMRYRIFVKAPNIFVQGDFQQGDLLIDTNTNDLDSKTGLNKSYRIINDPEFFFDSHVEVVADRVRGN